MPLIACPGCSAKIDGSSPSCPHCGHTVAPTTAATPSTATENGIPAQTPGREWKIVRLTGVLLMLTGVIAWSAKSTDAGMVFLLGCLIYLGGRLGAWWAQRT